MRKVILLTDSTADLSLDLLKEYRIESLPLYVRFGDDTYRDGIDIDTNKLYEMVEKNGDLPKTAAISPGDFHDTFKKFIDQDYDIVYIGIGAKISATYQSAMLAKNEFPEDRIYVLNSDNLSSGIALSLLKAKDLRDQGKTAQEIASIINDIIPQVRSQFSIMTLDYLHKGGRASGLSKLVGTFLKIKPIIQVRDGKLDVYKKPRGKMTRALDIMLEDFFALGDKIDLDYVMITHTKSDENATYMIQKVKEKVKPKHLIVSNAGCVISSHCGPGTIGILYIEKK